MNNSEFTSPKNYIWPFGLYRGKAVATIPTFQLKWINKESATPGSLFKGPLLAVVRQELKNRRVKLSK